jgi:hypothetical protein
MGAVRGCVHQRLVKEGMVMAFLPDTNLRISLLKQPGGKLGARVRSQPVGDILARASRSEWVNSGA